MIKDIVDKINQLENEVVKLSNDQLRARTQWFRQRLKLGETLTDLIPDAFATVCCAAA